MAEDRLDKIEKEFSEFRKEFKGISENLKLLAEEKKESLANDARDVAKRALSRGEDLYSDVRGQFNQVTGSVESRIKDNPLSTLAIVAAIGFAVGFLSRRR